MVLRLSLPLRLSALCLTLVLLASVVVPSATAQDDIRFAPRIGASISTVRSDSASNLSTKTSITGGVAMRVPLPGPVSLQPELLIDPKGTDVVGDRGGSVRFSAIYTVLPVQVRAALPSIRTVTPHVAAGGFGAVKIFEQQSLGGGRLQVPTDFDQSFYRRFDAGVSAEVGATWDRLGVSVRYSHGLLNVVKDLAEAPFPDNPEQRPPGDGTSAAWTIGVSFGL